MGDIVHTQWAVVNDARDEISYHVATTTIKSTDLVPGPIVS